jgi:hypothetical protein
VRCTHSLSPQAYHPLEINGSVKNRPPYILFPNAAACAGALVQCLADVALAESQAPKTLDRYIFLIAVIPDCHQPIPMTLRKNPSHNLLTNLFAAFLGLLSISESHGQIFISTSTLGSINEYNLDGTFVESNINIVGGVYSRFEGPGLQIDNGSFFMPITSSGTVEQYYLSNTDLNANPLPSGVQQLNIGAPLYIDEPSTTAFSVGGGTLAVINSSFQSLRLFNVDNPNQIALINLSQRLTMYHLTAGTYFSKQATLLVSTPTRGHW